jgi:hypothetical protein
MILDHPNRIFGSHLTDEERVHVDAGVFDRDFMQREIVLGYSRRGAKTPRDGWNNVPKTVAQHVRDLLDHKVGPKDGPCYLQGALAGKVRDKRTVERLHFIVLDADTGDDPALIERNARELGCFAVIASTHSHGKAATEVNKDDLLKFIGGSGRTPTLEDARAYLKEVKGYRDHVVATVAKVEPGRDGEGRAAFRVHHAPMNKMRVLLVLQEPFGFDDPSRLDEEVRQDWAELLAGLARQLGVHFDEACTDVSRLFYYSRHAEGAPWFVRVVDGAAVDHRMVPRVKAAAGKRAAGRGTPARQGNEPPRPQRYARKGLPLFMTTYGAFLDVRGLLEGLGYETRGGDGVQLTVECPNEAQHSATEGPDLGCIAVNPEESDSGQPVITCRHAHCAELSTWDMIDLVLREHDLPLSALGAYLAPCEETPEFAWDDARGLPIVPPEAAFAEIRRRVEAGQHALPEHKARFEALVRSCAGHGGALLQGEVKRYLKAKKVIGAGTFDALVKEERRKAAAAPIDAPGNQIAHRQQPHAAIIARLQRDLAARDPERRKYFYHGGALGRLEEDREGVRFEPYTLDRLGAKLDNAYAWIARCTPEGEAEYAACPRSLVTALLSGTGAQRLLPELKHIARVPYLDPSGELVLEPGFRESCGTFLAPNFDASGLADLPREPTRAELDEALGLFTEWLLVDFPFVDLASRNAVLALLLSFLMRPYVQGPVPLFLLTKTLPGTGASLLVETCVRVVTGEVVTSTKFEHRDEEMAKVLTAQLRASPAYVFFDNVNDKLEGSALASVLTQESWSGRLLGSSTTVRPAVRAVWIASGNNVDCSDELARRCVPIRLDPKRPDPEKRAGFKIAGGEAGLKGWAQRHRPRLIRALLVMIRAWQAAGRPAAPGVRMASFDAWAAAVGGVLQVTLPEGEWAFLDNRDAFLADKKEGIDTLTQLVTVWHEHFGTRPVTVGSLPDDRRELAQLKIAAVPGTLLELLVQEAEQLVIPGVTTAPARGWQMRLGRYLKSCTGVVVYLEVKHEVPDGRNRWRTETKTVRACIGFKRSGSTRAYQLEILEDQEEQPEQPEGAEAGLMEGWEEAEEWAQLEGTDALLTAAEQHRWDSLVGRDDRSAQEEQAWARLVSLRWDREQARERERNCATRQASEAARAAACARPARGREGVARGDGCVGEAVMG